MLDVFWSCRLGQPAEINTIATAAAECHRITCGSTFGAICLKNHKIEFFGFSFYGEIIDSNTLPPISDISAGSHHFLAISTSGICYGWGSNSHGQLGSLTSSQPIEMLNNCILCAAGHQHSILIQSDGTMYVNTKRVYTFTSLPISLDTGAFHTAVACADGTVWTYGWGLYHQLGHDSSEYSHQPKCVDALLGIGVYANNTFNGICQVACGAWHTAALSYTGDVYTFGWNRDGQLGHSSQKIQMCSVPRVISTIEEHITQISCGTRHTSVLSSSGKIITFGHGKSNETKKSFITNFAAGNFGTVGY